MESSVPSAPKMSFTESSDQPMYSKQSTLSQPFTNKQPKAKQSSFQPTSYLSGNSIASYHIACSPVSFAGVPAPKARHPITVVCDMCKSHVKSEVKVVAGARTLITCFLCCMLGLWPCYYCVFCIDSLQDIEHRCPACSNLLGIRKACS